MRRLNLEQCNFSTEHFVPNIIMDRNLYDDIEMETGTIDCNVRVKNNSEDEIKNAGVKFIMLLEAFNDGYVKAVRGFEHQLKTIFCIVGQPNVVYIGANTVNVNVKILTLIYNPSMHMSVLKDAIAAGETMLFPDARNYFEITMDDKIVPYKDIDAAVKIMETQRDKFRETIVNNMLSV